MINNPILKGFNPDPSILRVKDNYYIATSTFEWFPGVQIHRSKDLVNWELIGHALTRKSQLNMLGNPDSGGVWAPCLSYQNGTFFLVFTDVKSHLGPYKDTHNYVVTATNIEGPWSDPIYLNSSGFDPSFFHDEDGKTWLVNLKWDHRKGKNPFGGIIIQEYDKEKKCLTGPIRTIFKGTELGLTEGPHIYKLGEYFYLFVAEGGTRYEHAATIARSKNLFGPYNADPEGPLLTSSANRELTLQKAGHASLVESVDGNYYIAHLCSRPLRPKMRCTLGRETALQEAVFTEDGWIRLAQGTNNPLDKVKIANEKLLEEKQSFIENFDQNKISQHLNTLREPIDNSWASLTDNPGSLRLYGRESLYSKHQQSLIARRQQSHSFTAETSFEYNPESYQQMAGLIYYYNTQNYIYLSASYDEDLEKSFISIMSSDRGDYEEPLNTPLIIEERVKKYKMRVIVQEDELQFYLAINEGTFKEIGPVLDASKISDDYVEAEYYGKMIDQAFTGAFIGICAQDLSGRKKYADFDYFKYEEK
ncbi:glycoside hydrolase family 43 protein [Gracilibacillus oryzae]|uniref:Glycoside hydrolase family 43 protein n=1 Tax=Gracilibacillus oryzae TaxID=1672701 RepID=A0A7C8GSF0_9BACI|nr:glycoside hydrolase family 43 protein [Gracilibacillus oryzae]KAB8131004.1 glycoside hydrolase family 43 protein [Gracilibacillus oryzae]